MGSSLTTSKKLALGMMALPMLPAAYVLADLGIKSIYRNARWVMERPHLKGNTLHVICKPESRKPTIGMIEKFTGHHFVDFRNTPSCNIKWIQQFCLESPAPTFKMTVNGFDVELSPHCPKTRLYTAHAVYEFATAAKN